MRHYLFKNKRLAIIFMIFEILAISIPVINVVCFQVFISAIEHGNQTQFIFSIMLFVIFVFGSVGLNILYQKTKRAYLSKTIGDIHQDLFQGILNQDYLKMKKRDSGYYISLFQNDVKMVEEKYITTVFLMCGSFVQLIVCMMYAAYYNVTISLIILIISVISLKFPALLARNLATYNHQDMEQQSTYISFLKDTFSGFEIIYNFVAKKAFAKQHKMFTEKTMDIHYFTKYKQNIVAYTTTMLDIGYSFLILMISGYAVLNGDMEIAVMFSMFSLADRVFYPLIEIINSINDVKSTKKVREKLQKLINMSGDEDTGNVLSEPFHEYQVQNLQFQYPNQNNLALSKLNITIQANHKYAIVGDSGSGKSTLIKILLGYYQQFEGKCLLNQYDIRDISFSSLHKMIAVIPQQVYVFEGTLQDNITLFQETGTKRINQCIEKAGLQDLLSRLPKGLDTVMDESGANFSGGEKQRIAIARAYYMNASVMIFDEAFSALDNRGANALENELLQTSNMTFISITHRLQREILMQYDRIFVMKDGRLAEVGTYDELVNQNGAFMNLYQLYTMKHV